MNWLGYIFDLSCDIYYYVVMPQYYPALQYVSLASIVAPHIVNLVILTRADGISGVVATLFVGLGMHEITSDDSNPDNDLVRSVNVICEDIPQFSLTSFNTLALGTSTSFVSILSPAKGLHAILTKFRSEVTVRMRDEPAARDFGINVNDYSWRLRKACLAVLLSTGPVLSTVITMQQMYFSFGMDEEWYTDREFLKRPSLFEHIWSKIATIALISAFMIFVFVNTYMICEKHSR